jgi:methylated-DNA-[protein]-cysteine S-methyltransferase
MTVTMWFIEIDSPVGPMRLATDGAGLRRIDFLTGLAGRQAPAGWMRAEAPLAGVVEQLKAYFAGALRDFNAPLAPQGTPFQQRVWRCLREIPYGETISYSELATRVGNPQAFRAVGLANGQNPIPILIPCHRVIGKDGTLVGYGGGLHIKEKLLALERGRSEHCSPGA